MNKDFQSETVANWIYLGKDNLTYYVRLQYYSSAAIDRQLAMIVYASEEEFDPVWMLGGFTIDCVKSSSLQDHQKRMSVYFDSDLSEFMYIKASKYINFE